MHEALLDVRNSWQASSVDIKEIRFIEALLVDGLEESEVTTFEPEVGLDVRQLGDRVSDALEIIETDDPEMDYKIAEVIAAGYETYGSEEASVIQPARVKIYRTRVEKPQKNEVQGA